MTITKNESQSHVSVNGFPLSIKVTFTVDELYNSMGISSATDPTSFLFNETLNDYLASIAGLSPSNETLAQKKTMAAGAVQDYFTSSDGLIADILSTPLENIENLAFY